jgi:hypothetical protein
MSKGGDAWLNGYTTFSLVCNPTFHQGAAHSEYYALWCTVYALCVNDAHPPMSDYTWEPGTPDVKDTT